MQYLYFFAELGKEKSVTLTNATAEDISKHIEALGKAQWELSASQQVPPYQRGLFENVRKLYVTKQMELQLEWK